ncbi:MAG: metallophosphoesterase [Candidatus Hydrogenedentota bacterium]
MSSHDIRLELPSGRPVVFFADVHLGASPRAEQRFAAFMRAVPRDVILVSLGDLVDYWAEGPGWSLVDAFPVLQAFRGREAWFLKGNRDFLMGAQWEHVTGGHVLGDSIALSAWGKEIVCAHGDDLLTGDVRYQFWKRICRTELFRNVSGVLGKKFALKTAKGLRKGSAREVARKPAESLRIDFVAAGRMLKDRDLLLCGHTHRPARRQIALGEMITLGSWDEDAEIVILDAKGLRFDGAARLFPGIE